MERLGINNSVVRGTGIPNYSNAYKEQSAMIFIANRYTRIYFSIIENARARVLSKDQYKETHHIIPRSMGGDNSSYNLVDLTAREHFICHKLLVRMTEGESRGKMAFALVLMSGKRGSKIYDSTRKLLAEGLSYLHTGKSPITNGIIDKTLFKDEPMPEGFYYGFSPATIKKHGDGNKGKKWITNGIVSYQPKDDILPEGFYYGLAEYHKKKVSQALSGSGNPMYGKFGIDHPAYGNKLTDETKKLMSDSKTGANNPNFGKATANAIQIEINGVLYRSAAEAKKKTGLSRGTIEKFYKE
jgi:NUMOD3 motif